MPNKVVMMLAMDPNFSRAGAGIARLGRGFGAGAARYFVAKVPIVKWLPNYSSKFIISDMIAGISVGLLLVAQSLTVTVFTGGKPSTALLSSWLPGLIYAVMGTSKDMSLGPSLASSLATAGLIKTIEEKSPQPIPPAIIAAVVSFGVGFWSLLFGLLNFGFIFTMFSNPVFDGFVMGITQIIVLLQIPVILGLTGITPVLSKVMGEMIEKIGKTNGASVGLGVATIVLMVVIGIVAGKLARVKPMIGLAASLKHIILITIFAGVSYGLNNSRKEPYWQVIGPSNTGLKSPALPNSKMLSSLFMGTIGIALGTALEHVALARSFGTSKGYAINPSQELVTLGITNLMNSLFGGGPVSSDLARSCFSASAGAKSPLSGLFTSATVLVAMFSPGWLRYIPNTVIAGMTLITVLEAAPPMALLGVHFKTSFADFMVMLMSFNIAMMASGEIGILGGLFISTMYTIFRNVSTKPLPLSGADIEKRNGQESVWSIGEQVPDGTQIIAIPRDLTYMSAPRIKKYMMNEIFIHFFGSPPTERQYAQRVWNFHRDNYIANLRRKHGVNRAETTRLRLVIIDFTACSFLDISAIMMLEQVKKELRDFGGDIVEFRFAGMNAAVKKRFQRYGWKISSPYDSKQVPSESDKAPRKDAVPEQEDLIFDHLATAIRHQEGLQRVSTADSRYDIEQSMGMGKF
ncbi:hypothetical protein HYALB_00002937 [Hymenoscyphus albidus]|uniref:STAS domain-containing protein n=1 Tax=Hymenoscyphus albidus TaxID=595503 RepID=A0A9N9QC94_9HELO|nr:hypothetical protein HYALB_00002937 [Hymenoscyphus albidus]